MRFSQRRVLFLECLLALERPLGRTHLTACETACERGSEGGRDGRATATFPGTVPTKIIHVCWLYERDGVSILELRDESERVESMLSKNRGAASQAQSLEPRVDRATTVTRRSLPTRSTALRQRTRSSLRTCRRTRSSL